MDLILKYFSDFTEKQLSQLASLKDLYEAWNARINVISRKDIQSLYEKHVLHSLSIAAAFNFPGGSSIIDIGTGGGFPGIPLAIYFPDVQFHLVDSIAKKLKVVTEVAAAAGLSNVSTEHVRAEDIAGRKFDFAVSRAVGPLKQLWQWSRPLLNISKQHAPGDVLPGLICLKGGDLAQEISDSNTTPQLASVYDLFPEDYFRDKYLVYIRK